MTDLEQLKLEIRDGREEQRQDMRRLESKFDLAMNGRGREPGILTRLALIENWIAGAGWTVKIVVTFAIVGVLSAISSLIMFVKSKGGIL